MMPFDKAWERTAGIRGPFGLRPGRLLFKYACLVPDDQMIVEVGSYHGKSAALLSATGRTVWLIDPMPPMDYGTWKIDPTSDALILRANVARWPNVTWHRCVAEDIPEPPMTVGLVFIDGNHDGDWPRRDFDAIARYMKQGGVIVWHDYGRPCAVGETVDKLVTDGIVEKVELGAFTFVSRLL